MHIAMYPVKTCKQASYWQHCQSIAALLHGCSQTSDGLAIVGLNQKFPQIKDFRTLLILYLYTLNLDQILVDINLKRNLLYGYDSGITKKKLIIILQQQIADFKAHFKVLDTKGYEIFTCQLCVQLSLSPPSRVPLKIVSTPMRRSFKLYNVP